MPEPSHTHTPFASHFSAWASFDYMFIWQIFIEHLLCVKHCSSLERGTDNKQKSKYVVTSGISSAKEARSCHCGHEKESSSEGGGRGLWASWGRCSEEAGRAEKLGPGR